MTWINLYNKDGQKINLKSLGLLGLRLGIPSPSYETESESAEGGSGEIVIEEKILPRELSAVFWIMSNSYKESLLDRNKAYAILGNGKEYYVEESNNPGRRWLARIGGWNPERINPRIQEFEIPMIAYTGLAESVNVISRSYSDISFNFHNEGDRIINMRHQTETELIFKGASDGLTITNLTTGDVWEYTESTAANDTILLKGVRSLKNGESIFGRTNKRLISLAAGNNELKITGNTGAFELTIRTRFYFL